MSDSTGVLLKLGRTDIAVSPVAVGCWAIVGDSTWGPQDEQEAVAGLQAAFDAGVNFFDTAEGYGAGYSEELVGKALGHVRDKVVIGSKVSPDHAGTRESLSRACDDSLRRLGTDYMDVYHLHWPNRNVPIDDIVGWFARLRESGKIRSFAVSNFGKLDLTDLLAHGRCEVNQLPYSLLWRVIEQEVLPICLRHDISVTCYSPLAQALLTGKFATADDVPEGRARTRHFSGTRPQARHGETGCEKETFAALRTIAALAETAGCSMAELALGWLTAQPGVASVLVGVRNRQQAEQNARAMRLQIDPDLLEELDRATTDLRALFGTNPDMWQSASRYR